MRRQSAALFIASGLFAAQAQIEAKAQSTPEPDATAQSTQQTPSATQGEATSLPPLEVVAQSKKSKKAKPKPQAKAKAAPDTTVAAAPAPSPTEDGSRAETATGPVNGYAASQSATGTKTDTPIIETPQGISVVGAEQMQEQKATDLQKALAYSSGIATGVVASNPATSDSFFIRGFQADPQFGSFYRDGMRYAARIFNGKQEPYGLERVEVLKGPASVLYGAAAPGGVINTVSKRPLQTPFHEINVEYGTDNRKQVSTDLSGPLDAAGVWSYRLTAVGRDSDTFVDFSEDDTAYLAPALTWRPSSSTSLTLLTSYHKMEASNASTLPVVGTLLPNPNGTIPRDRFIGEPDHNKFDNTTMTAAYLFEHKFSDALTFRHSLRGYKSELDSEYTLLAPVSGNVWADADQRLARRRLNKFDDETTMLTTDTNVESTFHTGDIRHKLLVGLDYADAEYHTKRWRGDLTPLDVFNPVYGATPATMIPRGNESDIQERTGLYFQDQIKIADRWVFLLGGRQDWMTFGIENHETSAKEQLDKESAFTARAGLVYLADNGLAPFFSYSESFEPTSELGTNETILPPSEGEQYEAGIRYQPKGTDTMVTASVYQLTRTNVASPTGDGIHYFSTGEVRSRGIELEATTQVGQHLNLIAAYTYNDTRIVQGNKIGTDPDAENGTRFPGIPEHVASLWVDYDLNAFGWSGWSVGAGARYVSDRPGSETRGALGTPAYTLIDARIGYEVGKWEYALNLSNLTDERYIPSVCYQFAVGCDYGAPMSAIATASYRW